MFGIETDPRHQTLPVRPLAFTHLRFGENGLPKARSVIARFLTLLRLCRRHGIRYLFMGNAEDPAIFAVASVLRCLGRPAFTLQEGKFDDKDRRIGVEALRTLFHLPYSGAIAGSHRAADYLSFLGLRADRIFLGYDTISVERVRRAADAALSRIGGHKSDDFVVLCRFASPAALKHILEAYAQYAGAQDRPRALRFCGACEESAAMLRETAQSMALHSVEFCEPGADGSVAETIASGFAVIQPGLEVPHGLSVGEAIALEIPVLISEDCAARDLLVRSGVNGYVYEPDNREGLAQFMRKLDEDEGHWKRLSRGCRAFAQKADASLFAQSIGDAIQAAAGGSALAEQGA